MLCQVTALSLSPILLTSQFANVPVVCMCYINLSCFVVGYSELCVFDENGSKQDKMTSTPSEADQVGPYCVVVLGGGHSSL